MNLIEDRGDQSVSVGGLGLTRISQVVGKIGVEWFPLGNYDLRFLLSVGGM